MTSDRTLESQLIWRNLIRGGKEHFRLWRATDRWIFQGTVTDSVEDGRPLLVEYELVCDLQWRTITVVIHQVLASEPRDIALQSDGEGSWKMNGKSAFALPGCLDIDLSITPATNTLPIRRLDLAVGKSERVVAAWLRFPELILEPLWQTYTRVEEFRYRYESDTGFSTEIEVDGSGLIASYPPAWVRRDL